MQYSKIAPADSNKRKLQIPDTPPKPNKKPFCKTLSFSSTTTPPGFRRSDSNKENYTHSNGFDPTHFDQTPEKPSHEAPQNQESERSFIPEECVLTPIVNGSRQKVRDLVQAFRERTASTSITKQYERTFSNFANRSNSNASMLFLLSLELNGFAERNAFFELLTTPQLELLYTGSESASALIPMHNKLQGSFLLSATIEAIGRCLEEKKGDEQL